MITACRKTTLVYRLALIALAGYGLADGFGLLRGQFNCCAFVYFTDVSNLLGFLYFVGVVVCGGLLLNHPNGSDLFLPRVKASVTMGLTLTLLVNHFVLGGSPFLMTHDASGDHLDAANLFVHYLVPVMAICDAVLFDKKGNLRPFDPWVYEIVPCAYFGYVLIRAQIGGPIANGRFYPYAFLDVNALGFGRVMLHAVAVALGLLALGYAAYGVDRLLGRRAIETCGRE